MIARQIPASTLAATRAFAARVAHAYLALMDAAREPGLPKIDLKDAGYYALDALRIEAGRRAWGAELGPDETPFEAGLTYAVKLNKATAFIGKTALIAKLPQPLKKKLITVVLDSPDVYAWGGEGIVIDDEIVGELTSVGWSPKANACVGFGYARGAAAHRTHHDTPIQIELWGERVSARAWDSWPPQNPTQQMRSKLV